MKSQTPLKVTIMGVGRIFSKGEIVLFPGVTKRFFQGGAKRGEISFYPLETKRTTFFAKKYNRKMSHFKIQGCTKASTAIPFRRTWSQLSNITAFGFFTS